MSALLPMIAAGFLAGLLGSAHCLGMCGGISGLFAVNVEARSLASRMPLALTYNLGRILSYVILGTIVALFGSTLVDAIPRLAGPVRLVSGAVMILIGLQIAFNWRFLRPLESMGAALWAKVSPAARGLMPVTNVPRALGLGLIWGLLPCGLVYSVLLIAATSETPAGGGLVMAAFGIGTTEVAHVLATQCLTPAMVLTGVGALQLSRFMARKGTRLAAGVLIIVVGALTLAMPVNKLLTPGDGMHHHHNQTQG